MILGGMRVGGRAIRVGQGIAAAVLALALLAGTADAASLSKSGATLTYTASNNETNHLVVSLASGTYTFDDSGATVTPGSGCTRVSTTKATCAGAGVNAISVDTGNLNDLAWVTASTASTISGGIGNDSLLGAGANDILIGCDGDDWMNGGGGGDLLFDGFFNCPGGGNDTFDGGTGADSVFGGPGSDTVTYSGRTASVYVSNDGAANDGEAGEGDSVSTDTENVTGGSGDDLISGGPGSNTLRGGAGNDVLTGERNPDPNAAGGNDNIFGDAGNDALAGGDGDNLLVGGDGNDTIDGGIGADSFDGGNGNDVLRALDGVIDALNCGAGSDSGEADVNDVVSSSCEAVNRSDFGSDDFPPDFGDPGSIDFCSSDEPAAALPPDEGISATGGSGEGTGDSGFPCSDASIPCAALRVSHHPVSLVAGEVGIRLTLPDEAPGACRGRLKLSLVEKPRKADAARTKLGGEAFTLRPGQSKRFGVQINRAGRRLVRRSEHLKIRVGVFGKVAGELTKVTSAVVALEPPDRAPNRG
jgi:RTX calcium-binding nonapeptide repeat (4 copies)